LGTQTFGKLFLPFFERSQRRTDEFLPLEERKVRMRMVTVVFTISMPLNEVSKT